MPAFEGKAGIEANKLQIYAQFLVYISLCSGPNLTILIELHIKYPNIIWPFFNHYSNLIWFTCPRQLE
jgi:hypothetical protein